MEPAHKMTSRGVYNITADFPSTLAPLYPQAIVFPVLGFPAWILCLPPLVWHFRQGNIAAGSLIAWITMNNFFNSINALIWPHDNLVDWWDGNVWCDIHVRLQVGATVGIAASTVMIVRKLAKVMDTRNITVSSSRNSKIKEKMWEVLACWGYPLFMILIYYVVQPARYFIFGIYGCISAFATSWPTIVLSFMWAPITMCVAAYYAVLLIYRLYRYRREFHRLVAARNTTKSRFIRIFILCMIVIIVYLPYSVWYVVSLRGSFTDTYNWNEIHGPNFNTIIKIPVFGQVPVGKWVQIGTGYVVLLVFGTGNDAHNLYQRMLLAVGLGKIFPSLYITRESRSATPSSFIAAKAWTSSMGSKAKSMFWSKTEASTSTFDGTTRNNSVVLDSVPHHLHAVTTEGTLLKQHQHQHQQNAQPRPSSTAPSFFKRIFRHTNNQGAVLPLFASRRVTGSPNAYTSPAQSVSPGVLTHAWAANRSASRPPSELDGVHIMREVHQNSHERDEVENAKLASVDLA